MIAELGYLALTISLAFSILLTVYPLWGAHTGNLRLMQTAPSFAIGQFLFSGASFAILVYASLHDDFTLAYVASHSSTSLPWYYKITSTWGGHEGAVLLWVVMQTGWTAVVAVASRSLPWLLRARVLSVLGFLGLGFILYTLLMSSPFERLLPYYPIEGHDLNPLLQDPGMIIHPPLLYMGYVGLSVSFAFAIAALLTGKLDNTWAKWSRPWTMAAWIFLTLGITIGSWWAYAELGWGGWWFWDPVENASLMPWLIATALIHSLAVTEKRGVFKSWTVLLAIAGFSLTLLGTFIVRSGIIVSVHAFTTDPGRGSFILSFLAIVVGGSLILYALRAGAVASVGRYSLVSREVALWLNNLLLCVATLIVLLGTLLPMIHKELGLGTISIGVPFFNQMFFFLLIPFAFLLGIAPMLRWKQNQLGRLTKPVVGLFVATAVVVCTWLYTKYENVSVTTLVAVFFALWVVFTTMFDTISKWQQQGKGIAGLRRLGNGHLAMTLGHLGFACVVLGVALTSAYSVEKHVKVQVGEEIQLNDYIYRFEGVKAIKGPNYSGHAGMVRVFKEGEFVTKLYAEKRVYKVGMQVMTEAAVDANLNRDLYLALGDQFDNGAWGLRVYEKPFVRWMWLGGFLMAFAGVAMMLDKRYRRASVSHTAPVEAQGVSA